MTIPCCADIELSADSVTPSKQRRRTSNRIKLSRELMIRLTAALSNGGGSGLGLAGGASCTITDTELIRNGQVANGIDGASVVVSSHISRIANERQPTKNSFFVEGRGPNTNCDNNSQKQQHQTQVSVTNKSPPSSASSISNKKRDLDFIHLASSMKSDCSSILDDIHEDTCYQAMLMPKQENPPIDSRKSAATATAGVNENDNDDDSCCYNICATKINNKHCATSQGGGKQSDADKNTHNSTVLWDKSTTNLTGFSKSSDNNVVDSCKVTSLFTCEKSSPAIVTEIVKPENNYDRLKVNVGEPTTTTSLLKQSATIIGDSNLKKKKKKKRQLSNANNSTNCCSVESHESSNICNQISPSWRDKKQQRQQQQGRRERKRRKETRNGRREQKANCSSKVLQMSMLNSIDHTSSSFLPNTLKTNTTNTTKTSNLNLNLNLDLNFNDSLNRRILQQCEQQQQLVEGEEKLASNDHVNLAQDLRQRHVPRRKQQRIVEQQVVVPGTSSSSGGNDLLCESTSRGFIKLGEKSSSSKVIKVNPTKLNLSIETNENNSNNNNNKLLFLNKDEGEEEKDNEDDNEVIEREREIETGIVSNHSSVIILKAIKVDSNLHLNSNLSSCSIKDTKNSNEKGSLEANTRNFKQQDIICTTATTSSKISSDKQAHVLCFLPKPIQIVVEKEEDVVAVAAATQDVAATTSDKQQQQVVKSSVMKTKNSSREENEENMLINSTTTEKINNKKRFKNNNHKTNNNSNNSRISGFSYSGNINIETGNNSSESFECDNNNEKKKKKKEKRKTKSIEKRDPFEKKEVAGFEEDKRKKAWRPEVSQSATNLEVNDHDNDVDQCNNLLLDWKCIKRGKQYENRSLIIWFSMILLGCLLLSFDSNNDRTFSGSLLKLPLGLVSPLGRVSGQSTSDEFSRAVLATMTTQSPNLLNNNNSIGQYGSTSLPENELVDSYMTNDNNNNQYDQQQQQQQNQNNASSSSASLIDKFLDFGRIFIIGAIIIGDICGNSLVILSVCRHSKLRVTTNWFVVSLACADILVAVFAMTFNASVIISGRWLFKPWVCDFWNSCDVLASTASILHLCCISIDRYIAITRPLDYPMKITTRRVIYALCGVWISSALLSYLPIFTGVYTTAEHIKWLNDNPEQCDFVVNRVYAIVSSSISFWIPSSIMVFTYYRIYKEATRQEKFMYKQQSIMPAPVANHHHHREHRDHHDSSGNQFNNKSSAANRAKQRRSKSMAVSTSSTSNTFSSNEARIRQLAKQQQELQPTSGLATLGSTSTTTTTSASASASASALTNQRQTNSFNSVATTNLNSTSSIPESTAQQSNQTSSTAAADSVTNNKLNQAAQNLDTTTAATTTTERASSLLQLSAATESQPLTAQTTTTTSLSVVPNNNNVGGDSKTTTGPAFTDSKNKLPVPATKKQSPAVAFDEGEEDDDDDDQDSNSGQSTPTKRSISKMKREHKAAKTLGIIMGVFILCWLPFFSWYTPQHICGHACDGIVPRGAVTILFWIGYFNSTLNPIIYAYFNHEFRDAFKKTLQWIFCCCNDLKCLRVNRPNDNQHYNCTYRSTQEIGLVSNS